MILYVCTVLKTGFLCTYQNEDLQVREQHVKPVVFQSDVRANSHQRDSIQLSLWVSERSRGPAVPLETEQMETLQHTCYPAMTKINNFHW